MLASLAAPSHSSLLAALEETRTPHRHAAPMPSRRTIRKPTRWTPEEWRQIEDAARARGVPPLRYVREAALAGQLPPSAARRVRARRDAHELVRQLKRLLNNLNQLARVADEEGDEAAAQALAVAIATTEAAVRAAASKRGGADELAALVAEVIRAGRSLNEVTHHAHTIEELPPLHDLSVALSRILAAVHPVLR